MTDKRQTFVSVFLVAAALLSAAACQKTESFDNGSSPLTIDNQTKASTSLVSGYPVNAMVSNGLAPLSYNNVIQDQIIGYYFNLSSSAYPDLFFASPAPSKNYATGYEMGLNLAEFSGVSSTGELIYNTRHITLPTDHPWYDDCKVSDNIPDIRVRQVGSKILAFQLLSENGQYHLDIYKYNKTQKTFDSGRLGRFTFSVYYAGVAWDIVPKSTTEFDYVLLRNKNSSYKPKMDDISDCYYDGAGAYRGVLVPSRLYKNTLTFSTDYSSCKEAGFSAVTASACNMAIAAMGVTVLRDSDTSLDGAIAINKFGEINYSPAGHTGDAMTIVDEEGNALANFGISNGIFAFPQSKSSAKYTDFITSGEGPKFYYKYKGKKSLSGAPVYEKGKILLMNNGPLFAGSLSVPSVADWDGDGVLDIVSGASEGRILFFKNYGTNESPVFGLGDPLYSDGQEICFRSGYYEVQGTYESAWGYICPTVCDWNDDGLLDIVFSHNEGKFEVMLNEGTPGHPVLGPRQPLRLDGLELYGEWRVRPAVAKIGNDTFLVTEDLDEAFHLYRRTSLTTVEDKGVLKLSSGATLKSVNQTPKTLGARGRIKIELSDWDGDGVLDLIVGGPAQMGIPDASGYPRSSGTMQTLWLRNEGTNTDMKFSRPRAWLFKGKHYFLGSHASSPTACYLGTLSNGLPNLLVGCESGKFYFFNRTDLTEQTF